MATMQKPEVDDPASQCRDAVEGLSVPFGAVADCRSGEAPERVSAEADGEEREQDFAERLVGDGVERALLVRRSRLRGRVRGAARGRR